MCFGGSQKSTSQYTPAPQATQQYLSAWNAGVNASQTPFQQYGGEFTASENATQKQATNDITQSKDLYQPYFTQAGTLAGQAAQPMSVTPFSQEALQQYENPFMNQVVNSTMANMKQQQQQDQSSLKGNQLMSGAFGGSRGAIDQANLMKQQEMATGSTLSGLLSGNYQQAQQEFNQQQQQSLQQQEAQRQQEMQAAGLYSGLGTNENTMSLNNAQALMGAGTLEQQTAQNQDTAKYNQFLAERQYPFQTAQFLSNIAQGTGALEGGTTTSKVPKPFFSDKRVKENIEQIGKSYDGQTIYRFNYKGDKTTHIGFIAQEVEKKHPFAVGEQDGLKTVDYKAATDKAAKRGHFAEGGAANNPFDFQAPVIPQTGDISYVPQEEQSNENAPKPPTAAPQNSTGSTLGDIGQVAQVASTIAGLFSDERVKENIEPIGESFTGHQIYRYNYKGDPTTHMGLIAQEVEKKNPEAVGSYSGIKTVDYDKATKQDAARGKFAEGGSINGIPISYVPTFGASGGHSSNIPQVPAYQKPTSVLQDINSDVNQTKNLWNMLPNSAQNSISSMNPFSSASVGEGGLFNKGGSVRSGFDVGGSVNDDDDDDKDEDSDKGNAQVPSVLMGYPPLGANAYGTGSTPMPNPKQVFKSGLQAMEAPAGGPQQSDKSSAYGPYQFTEGTWNDLISRHPELNLTPADRMSADKQNIALDAHTDDLAANLQKNGQDVTAGNLYQSHFLGSGGGPRMIKAATEDPTAPAFQNATPAAVSANHSIFFNKDNTPRSTGEVAQIMQQSISGGKGWNMDTSEQGNPVPPGNISMPSGGMLPSNIDASTGSNPLAFSGDIPTGGSPLSPQTNPDQGGGLSNLFSVGPNGLNPTQKGLLSGVFGMLASPSTTFLGSLGEGGLKGMGAYQSGQDTDISRQLNMANMQRAQAQTGLEKQKLAFEQTKLPYELQATMAKTGAQRAIAASRMAGAMGFTPSIDTNTGQTVYTSKFGQTYTPDQMEQIRQNTINPMIQQAAGTTSQGMPAGLPPSAPQNGQPNLQAAGVPTNAAASAPSTTPQQSISDPAGAVTSNIKQGQSLGQALDTQKQQQDQAEQNFYKQNNVPDDQSPPALRQEATKLRQQADMIRFQPNKAPSIVKQMEDLDAQADKRDAKAKSIEESTKTTDAHGNDVQIKPLLDLKNKQKSQEAYAQELPKTNKDILEASSKEASAAKNIYSTTKNIRDLLYDDKKNEYKFKTGSFDDTRSLVSNTLAALGIDKVKGDDGNVVSLAKMLTGIQPGDKQMLTHIMTLAVPEMTKYQIPGQRFTNSELNKIEKGSVSADMLPQTILEMLDTQILPGTKYQIDRDNYLQSKSHNKATDDYQQLANQYDQEHPMTKAYEDARNEFDKKKSTLPSQSPFSETGKGIVAGVKSALGFNNAAPTTAPQQAPALPPSRTINGHQMYLWPNGKYSDTPPASATASRTD